MFILTKPLCLILFNDVLLYLYVYTGSFNTKVKSLCVQAHLTIKHFLISDSDSNNFILEGKQLLL